MVMSFIEFKNKYMPHGVIGYSQEQKDAFKRLHNVDLDEEYENAAKNEYNLYVTASQLRDKND